MSCHVSSDGRMLSMGTQPIHVHVGDNDILDGPMSGYTNPVPDCSNQIILNR